MVNHNMSDIMLIPKHGNINFGVLATCKLVCSLFLNDLSYQREQENNDFSNKEI